MPSHPLGRGTCNLSVNVKKAVRLTLGRIAFTRDESMGRFVRRLLGLAPAVVIGPGTLTHAANLDARIVRILRAAKADGVGPEDAAAIDQAIALAEGSERDDRQMALALNLEVA